MEQSYCSRARLLLQQVYDCDVSIDKKFLALRSLANRKQFGNRYRRFTRRQLNFATDKLVSGSRLERIEAYAQFADLLVFDEDMRRMFQKHFPVSWRSVFRNCSIQKVLRRSLRKIEAQSDAFSSALAALLLRRVQMKHAKAICHFLRYSDTRVAKDAILALSELVSTLRTWKRCVFKKAEKSLIAAILRDASVENKFFLGIALGRYFCEREATNSAIFIVVECIPHEESGGAAAIAGIALALGERGAWLTARLIDALKRNDDELAFFVLRSLPFLGEDAARESLPVVTEVFNCITSIVKQFDDYQPDDLMDLQHQAADTLCRLQILAPEAEEKVQG